MQGKIKKIIRDRGFGFISCESGDDIFFHRSVLIGINFNELEVGNNVTFEIEKGLDKTRAVNVNRIFKLTVTPPAKKKLEENLLKAKKDDRCIRLIHSPTNPNGLKFAFDRIREGDQIVETDEGKKVLLIGQDIGKSIEGMIIDVQETPNGSKFVIT